MRPESEVVAVLLALVSNALAQSGLSDSLDVETEKEVTEDGYRADLAIELDDKVIVVELKSGFGSTGELGPEIIPSGLAIKEAVRAKSGKEAEVIFLSPGGAPEYVRKGLQDSSGSPVYGADSKGLSELVRHIESAAGGPTVALPE